MNTRLNHVQNWPELAHKANWSVSGLAKNFGISIRTLELHFIKHFGQSPKIWLTKLRQQQAAELVREGLAVKEAAARLSYKHAHHFSRDFKKYWGCLPAKIDSDRPSSASFRVLV